MCSSESICAVLKTQMCSHQTNKIALEQSSHLLVTLVDAPENSRNAVIEHQKTFTFSRGGLQTLLFSSQITYVLSNGKERKIGASEALQKRLEWENLIFFAA